MNNHPNSSLHLVGLTGTGKTNFLVALDVTLDSQTDPDGLIHSGLAQDRPYLHPLKEQWLRGEIFDRTSRSQPPPPHQLLVKHPTSGATAGFNIPDLAGESFDAHFVTRSIPMELWERLQKATGLLLFVHCNHNADHTILEHDCFIEPEPSLESSTETKLKPSVGNSASEWRLEDAAMQVKLVELLQFFSEGIQRQEPLRVAVMVSAWDLVERINKSVRAAGAELPDEPEKFLTMRWPLLNQYFQSHTQKYSTRFYGVSARGGDNSEAEIKRLTEIDRPGNRILLVDGKHRSNDLTRPVRWLLGLSDTVSSHG